MNKRNLIILTLLLAIAGGAYLTLGGGDKEPATENHAHADKDEHGHGDEHKDDHAEGGEHGHGDKDEHAHGDEHKDDHTEAKPDADKHGEADEHGHGGEEGGHAEESKISDNAVKNLNIEILEVGSGMVQETVSVSGRVTLNQNGTAQVKARFPGVIRSVVKEPGEVVKAGDTLATVESNDSLQVYAVKSPVAGTIINRTANVGELAADTPLFVVADLSKLWAELFIFSKDGEKLKAGQKVRIQCLDDPVSTESTIALVLPTAEASSQTVVARAVIENADNHWRSGMNIRADVVLSEKQSPLVVKTEAIQRMEGNMVVFVQEEGGTYKAHPVETGMSDSQWTEIKSGLNAGQRYVAKNSFVVKADIGKAGAEHEH
ncbi:MAG: efflux RND transporter periplasmic adaptor subunit [Rickettsiales bacterium]|jgi:cobalt-zinc-cadmium efflux system membrane fusion protein|nr:efflux RND transporter periplasmic adaptor subunit [Rickettsiales bacterium]